jgi:hypothetical protein
MASGSRLLKSKRRTPSRDRPLPWQQSEHGEGMLNPIKLREASEQFY